MAQSGDGVGRCGKLAKHFALTTTTWLSQCNALRSKIAVALCLGSCCVLATGSPSLLAQTWKPEKNVEIIVGTSPGGALDRAARTVQKLMEQKRLVPSSTVINKPGGGHAVALTYLNQHAGDGHYLQVTSEPLLTNKITGKSQIAYTDYTAIALLFYEYMAFTVHADSPIKNGKDFVARLRQDPASLSDSVSTSVGNANHIALALVAKAAGAAPKRLKTLVFNSAGDARTALAGKHIDMIVTGPASIAPMVHAGTLRIVAIAAPQRVTGLLADVPTWKEQGVDVVAGTWRAVVAPRGLDKAQLSFWDGVFSQLARSEEWRTDLENNLFANTYASSAETRRFFDAQYVRLTEVLGELDLAK